MKLRIFTEPQQGADYQTLLLQDAQRLRARLPGVPEFLAQRGDGRRRHARLQGPVRDLPP